MDDALLATGTVRAAVGVGLLVSVVDVDVAQFVSDTTGAFISCDM